MVERKPDWLVDLQGDLPSESEGLKHHDRMSKANSGEFLEPLRRPHAVLLLALISRVVLTTDCYNAAKKKRSESLFFKRIELWLIRVFDVAHFINV
mgnify:CR=1 FL=1|jgi:hypothetical protein